MMGSPHHGRGSLGNSSPSLALEVKTKEVDICCCPCFPHMALTQASERQKTPDTLCKSVSSAGQKYDCFHFCKMSRNA